MRRIFVARDCLCRFSVLLILSAVAVGPWARLQAQQPQRPADGSAVADARRLQRMLNDDPPPAQVRSLVPAILSAARDPEQAPQMLPVLQRAIELIEPDAGDGGDFVQQAALLKQAATLAFDQLDPLQGEAHLQSLLQLYRQAQQRGDPRGDPLAWPRQLVEVALAYLRGDRLDAALEVLGELAELNLPEVRLVDGLDQAAAALNRRLHQLSTERRYDLLHAWVIPDETRTTPRCFSSHTPSEAPPSVFARALGERPSDAAFPVPHVGRFGGLFSVEWQLVDAARTSGRLRRLTNQLQRLADQQTPAADYLLHLARIANGEDSVALAQQLTQRLAEASLWSSSRPRPAGTRPQRLDLPIAWAVIGAACLGDAALEETSRVIFDQLAQMPAAGPAAALRWRYRRAAMQASLQRFPDQLDLLDDPALKHWTVGRSDQMGPMASGAAQPVWGQHEGHLFRLTGPGDDWLCFRYPLAGDFQFEVEALDGGTPRLQSQLGLDAVTFSPSGRSGNTRIGQLGRTDFLQRRSPFIRQETWPAFQRLKIEVAGESMTLSVNGHPIWTGPRPDAASPWLVLASPNQSWTLFRNPVLHGGAIPRQVHLADGNRLAGWSWYSEDEAAVVPQPSANRSPHAPRGDGGQTAATAAAEAEGTVARILRGLFGPAPAESRPQAGVAGTVRPSASPDIGLATLPESPWRLTDGVIRGQPPGPLRFGAANRLSYFRPLHSGESIEYEFHYAPGEHHVHPALGRLSFRLDPGGITVRWLTDRQQDWTGLPPEHAVVEPLSRRGPRTLPLQADQWNRLKLALDDDTVTLELNGTEVYVRKLETQIERRFSLCTEVGCEALVRAVVLRGPWPPALGGADADELVAHHQPPTAPRLEALGTLLAERHVADSAWHVQQRARALPLADRYDYLADWVLPAAGHATLRLALDFAPTDPAPPVMRLSEWDRERVQRGEAAGQSMIAVGGQLVSPALELVDAASRLDKLDELRRRVGQHASEDPTQQRGRLAMLAIIEIARQDFTAAGEQLVELFQRVEAGGQAAFADRWPETLAIAAALEHPETRALGRDLAFHLFFNQARGGQSSGSEAWRRQVIAMAGLAQWLDQRDDPESLAEFTAAPPLQQWRPVSAGNMKSFGSGYPKAHWEVLDDGPSNLASHGTDLLFFQSPLRGDYEVQAEVPAFGWRDTHLVAGGIFVGLVYTKNDYDFGNLSGIVSRLKFDPPMRNVGRTLRYRIVVRDDPVLDDSRAAGDSRSTAVQTTSVDGRVLRRQPLEADHPPWLAIRAPRQLAAAKQLRIAGQPRIPEQVRLSAPSDLTAWTSYHDDPSVNYGGPLWQRVAGDDHGAEIVGSHLPELAGARAESLLRYCRPMWEDGTIVYEFYYHGSGAHCHPALGRLAFMLHPNGVREHWITDGAYDRSGLDPANESVVEEHRRGPQPLPLEPGQWNRAELSLQGDTALLQLNGQLIYQRPLEITNQRQFGLFHFADQGEARVRDVVWRGDWPRQLPPVDQQELADDDVSGLDASLAELPEVFSHDFATDGFPEERFLIVHGEPRHIEPGPEGLVMRRPGADGYRNATISPRLAIEGDFDVTLTYEDLNTQAATPGSASLLLSAKLDNASAHQCTVQRRQMINDVGFEEQIYQTVLLREQDGQVRRNYSPKVPLEATGGRLRLSRRGEVVHYLIAEDDSPLFQLIRSERIGSEPLVTAGLYVMVQTHMVGSVSVTVKSIEVRATSLASSVQQGEQTVQRLDEQRQRLGDHFIHDFARHRFTSNRFHHWALQPDAVPQSDGQRVVGVAANDWRSAGAAPKLSLHGDFDISFDFEILRADLPRDGDSSSVYLQVEFPGEAQVQTTAIAQIMNTGSRQANSQVRLPDRRGGYEYRSLRHQQADDIRRLRLARRGGRLYWLYAVQGDPADHYLAEDDVPEGPIAPQHVRILVHTGGEDRITETLWKRLEIRAEQVVMVE